MTRDTTPDELRDLLEKAIRRNVWFNSSIHQLGGVSAAVDAILEDLPALLDAQAEAERLRGECQRAWQHANNELTEREAAQARADRLEGALRAILRMDDDARAAKDKPGASLNGLGLTDMFDCVGHPFGTGEHKQAAYRSVGLEVAITDARSALSPTQREGN